MSVLTRENIKTELLRLAAEYYQRGPGFAQQGPVLRMARNRLAPAGVAQEQQVLDCWHELFRDGELVWGYNLDNPDAPFFHMPVGSTVSGYADPDEIGS